MSRSLDASVESSSRSKSSLPDSDGSAQDLYCDAGAFVVVLHLRDSDMFRKGFDTGATGFEAGVRLELERSEELDVEFRKDGFRSLMLAPGRNWPREVEARSFGFWISLAPSPARLSRDGLGRSDDVELAAGAGVGDGAGWTTETGRGSRERRGMPLARLWELSIIHQSLVGIRFEKLDLRVPC